MNRAGKNSYIENIQSIEDRWFVFMTRLNLQNCVNEKFKSQTNEFLSGIGMDVRTFYECMNDAHQFMRDEADKD